MKKPSRLRGQTDTELHMLPAISIFIKKITAASQHLFLKTLTFSLTLNIAQMKHVWAALIRHVLFPYFIQNTNTQPGVHFIFSCTVHLFFAGHFFTRTVLFQINSPSFSIMSNTYSTEVKLFYKTPWGALRLLPCLLNLWLCQHSTNKNRPTASF